MLVVDIFGQADLNAVKGVHDLLETTEVDEHEVVDVETGHLLDRLDGAARSADLNRGVKARLVPADGAAVGLLALGQGDQGVARNAHGDSALAIGADVQQDRGVGAGAGDDPGLAVALIALALSGIAAHQQDIQWRVAAGLFVDQGRSRGFAGLVADVDRGDIARELPQKQVHACAHGRHRQDGEGEHRCHQAGPAAATGRGGHSGSFEGVPPW